MTGGQDAPNPGPRPGDHSPPSASETTPGAALPEPVRHRVLTMAGEALDALRADEVPPQLRPFARFTKAKRARLAATPIAAALHTDADFRESVAARVRMAQPDLAAALIAGEAPAAADPVDVAAVAYLLRCDGWTAYVEAAVVEVDRASAAARSAEAADSVDRLEAELAAVRAGSREELDRLRGELKTARTEIADLRRRLAEARSVSRQEAAAAAQAEAALADRSAAEERARSAGEAELRRLRSRLSGVEAELEAARRGAREGRTTADTRTRLLLDTLVEAAQGLRRELALPPATDRPADMVVAASPEVTVGQASGRAMSPDDPALLDDLLALPQVHLVVDGYNVTKTGYGNLPLETQRSRLLAGLAVLGAQTQAEVTCVFDGADVSGPVPTYRGVRVLFSRSGVSADEVIGRLVHLEPSGRPVLVVSDDREVADDARRAGARPLGAVLLLRWLDRN